MSARCALIEAEKATYKIAWMCALLGVARSSFYAWRGRTETPTAARRRQLAELVGEAFKQSRHVHGCRRIARDLNDAGHEVSVGTVAAIMRQLGLKAVQPRAYKRTTVPGRNSLQQDKRSFAVYASSEVTGRLCHTGKHTVAIEWRAGRLCALRFVPALRSSSCPSLQIG